MATFKGWRLLRTLRSSTHRITDIVKTAPALRQALVSRRGGRTRGCGAGHQQQCAPGGGHWREGAGRSCSREATVRGQDDAGEVGQQAGSARE